MGFEPIDFSEEQLNAANKLFANECRFVLGVAKLEQLPLTEMPEIAFAGRSNVGKSSLINAVTGKKGLAKTSNTPGRTQQLNYFNLADKIHIVDLPGYGYAQAPESMVKQWQRVIFAYLQGRVNLKRVFVLIDSRHGIKKVDLEIAPRRPGDPPRLIACSTRARRELGWQPEFENASAIIESAWKWHLDHPDGYAD